MSEGQPHKHLNAHMLYKVFKVFEVLQSVDASFLIVQNSTTISIKPKVTCRQPMAQKDSMKQVIMGPWLR